MPPLFVAEDVNLPDAERLRRAIPTTTTGNRTWRFAGTFTSSATHHERNFHKFRYAPRTELSQVPLRQPITSPRRAAIWTVLFRALVRCCPSNDRLEY
jgi:hypothetical protein